MGDININLEQVNHYIVSGDYTAPQSLLMKLAAIQFAMTYGAHKPSIHKPGFIEYVCECVCVSVRLFICVRLHFVPVYNQLIYIN